MPARRSLDNHLVMIVPFLESRFGVRFDRDVDLAELIPEIRCSLYLFRECSIFITTSCHFPRISVIYIVSSRRLLHINAYALDHIIPVTIPILPLPIVILTLSLSLWSNVFIPNGDVDASSRIGVHPVTSFLIHATIRHLLERLILIGIPCHLLLGPAEPEAVRDGVPHWNAFVSELENWEVVSCVIDMLNRTQVLILTRFMLKEDHILVVLTRRSDLETEPDVLKLLFEQLCIMVLNIIP